jgi:hypothetical protein
MTIALFSDIHANLRALETFFADVEAAAHDIEKSALPAEFADMLRKTY